MHSMTNMDAMAVTARSGRACARAWLVCIHTLRVARFWHPMCTGTWNRSQWRRRAVALVVGASGHQSASDRGGQNMISRALGRGALEGSRAYAVYFLQESFRDAAGGKKARSTGITRYREPTGYSRKAPTPESNV